MSLSWILLFGFSLGLRHATDPDHVVAVSTIVSRERSILASAWVGVVWGIGHTLTLLGVGTGIVAFGWVIPPRLGLTMEFSVAVMLVVLGALNLTALRRGAKRGDPVTKLDRRFGGMRLYQALRPFAIGIVHGLAGSAAVAILVLATTVRAPLWAAAYLSVFGVGTIAGMLLITAAISLPFAYTARTFGSLNRALALGSGVVSVLFGAFLMYQLGLVDDLFGANPHWTPN